MITQLRRGTLLAPLLMLLLAACGTSEPAAQSAPAQAAATSLPTATADGMAGMTPMPAATTGGMAGMDHGTMSGMAGDAPYDALFIDSMLVHHQGAISMAKQAQGQAEHPEIKQLAAAIISAQEAEISRMQQWRGAWYPTLALTKGMGMDMGKMEVVNDPSTPFDRRFMEAMIPHHQGAIAMAKDAQQKAEHPETKQLAGAIISAQEAEIAQMQSWLKDWYGVE